MLDAEHDLHKRLRECRIVNEWFLLSMAEVQQLAAWLRYEYVLHNQHTQNLLQNVRSVISASIEVSMSCTLPGVLVFVNSAYGYVIHNRTFIFS